MNHQPKGEKVIKSSIVKTVASYIIGISCVLFGAWEIISTWGNVSDSLLPELGIIGIGVYLIGNTLMAVDEIILKPEKIIIVGIFSEKELAHKQIRNIDLSSVSLRWGVRAKIVVLYPVSGSSIILTNRFGDLEFLYNTLMTWWEGPSENLYANLERD